MMINKITRELLREWGTCYTDERIAALVPPDGVAPIQVLDANIPAEDRLWALTRPGILTPCEAAAFARECAAWAALARDRAAWAAADNAAWAARAAADRERLRQLGAIRRLIAERNTK